MKRILGILLCCVMLSGSLTNIKAQESKSTEPANSLGLTSVLNARDMGGYKTSDGRYVAKGILFRSGSLENINPEDTAVLLNEYGIREIIDLRSEEEYGITPDPVWEGVKNRKVEKYVSMHANSYEPVAAIWVNEDDQSNAVKNALERIGYDAESFFADLYGNVFVNSETALLGYQRFFSLLMETEGPVLIHGGKTGKDRTGMAAFLLLSALGVDEDTAREDYLLSNDYLMELIQNELDKAQDENVDGSQLSQIFALCSVEQTNIDAAIEAMKGSYGSVEDFLKTAVGLTEDGMMFLRNKYLTDGEDEPAPEETPKPQEEGTTLMEMGMMVTTPVPTSAPTESTEKQDQQVTPETNHTGTDASDQNTGNDTGNNTGNNTGYNSNQDTTPSYQTNDTAQAEYPTYVQPVYTDTSENVTYESNSSVMEGSSYSDNAAPSYSYDSLPSNLEDIADMPVPVNEEDSYYNIIPSGQEDLGNMPIPVNED